MSSPTIINAHKLWAQFEARGVRLSVQWVRQGNGTRWPRVWLRGGEIRPGDFEAIARAKTELAALLDAANLIEGRPVEGCDYALTRGFDPPMRCLIPSPSVEAAQHALPRRRAGFKLLTYTILPRAAFWQDEVD